MRHREWESDCWSVILLMCLHTKKISTCIREKKNPLIDDVHQKSFGPRAMISDFRKFRHAESRSFRSIKGKIFKQKISTISIKLTWKNDELNFHRSTVDSESSEQRQSFKMSEDKWKRKVSCYLSSTIAIQMDLFEATIRIMLKGGLRRKANGGKEYDPCWMRSRRENGSV